MPAYKTKLLHRHEIAAGTTAFHFEKPPGFSFQAGQCMSVTLVDPPETDDEGNTRVFTIASAPFESELMLATRMRNRAFKRVLKTMSSDATVEIDGPYGDFTLHEDQSRPAAFLTGGIGVTPVLSMLRQAAHEKLQHPFYLFFSNRTPNEAPFLDELQKLQTKLENYTFVPTMTKLPATDKPWTGETGRVNEAMLTRYIDDLSQPIFYVVGPPDMALAMRKLLSDMGAQGDHVRFEEFSGY
jgi:ferredoxin-NADP reductase